MSMLYNKDPILPFQYADQMENCPDAENDMSNPFSTRDQDVNPFSTKDPVIDMVEKLELQRTAIFDKAGSKIANAQKIYARSYNNKHGAGIQFKVSNKCLKRNKWVDSHKAKLKKHFTGPYEVVAIAINGSNIFLKDRYSHYLKRSVPVNQLIQFHKDKLYKLDVKSKVTFDSDDVESGVLEDGHLSQSNSGNDFPSDTECCQRMRNYAASKAPLTSTPIKSQPVIVSSTEMPLSSDDSETIDVGNERADAFLNLWGDLNVDEIPLEIVDDLHQTGDSDLTIVGEESKNEHQFIPLNNDDHKQVGLKFGLALNNIDHLLNFKGVGKHLPNPPVVTISAKSDGGCLFNSLSILLSGRDIYAAILHHVLSNYIANPIKYTRLKSYIPQTYKGGKEYIVTTNMQNFRTWGTK